MKKFLTVFLLPVIMVGGGVAGAVTMIRSASSAERFAPAVEAPLVEVLELEAREGRAVVRGKGVVEPAREATLSPEVSGRVVYLSPNFVLGGRVKAGEVLLRLDQRDYKLAIRERRSQVQAAKLELEVEKGRGSIAQREWELLHEGEPNRKANPLVLREPHRENAEVALESASAALERAQRDLEKTTIKAPFNATVASEELEVGEVVAPGTVMATLVGSDQFWAQISLPIETLALIEVPGFGAEEGSPARVIQVLGNGQEVVRPGRVIRLVTELERESRTAQVLVAVDAPLDPSDGQLPLLPGAFVHVEIEGVTIPDVVPIPRLALSQGNQVWVVSEDGALERRELVVAYGSKEHVFASAGVKSGEQLVLTQLPGAIESMKVRTKPVDAPPVELATARADLSHEVSEGPSEG